MSIGKTSRAMRGALLVDRRPLSTHRARRSDGGCVRDGVLRQRWILLLQPTSRFGQRADFGRQASNNRSGFVGFLPGRLRSFGPFLESDSSLTPSRGRSANL